MVFLRLVLVFLVAFGLGWGGIAWRPSRAGVRSAPAGTSRAPSVRPPAGGTPLSCRQVVFNGTPSLVATYRFAGTPESVLDRVEIPLLARGLAARDLGPGFPPLTAEERADWREGRLFTCTRQGSAERLAYRDPKVGVVEVCLRPEGAGTLGLWSERSLAAWLPDGGDCPGRDLAGVGRPEGWLRLFCVESGEGLMLCYAAPQAPAKALAALAGRMEASGWKQGAAAGPGTCYEREGVRCWLSAEPDGEGAQVSVVTGQGA